MRRDSSLLSCAQHISTHANLVRSTGFGQISYPLDAVIVALLEHLQEAHNQPRGGEHEHLEVDIDWWACPDLAVRHACQRCSPRKRDFLATLYSRNSGTRTRRQMKQSGGKKGRLTSISQRSLQGHTSPSRRVLCNPR